MTTESTRSFDLQPTFKGDLLELRPLRPEDFDDLYAAASDPLLWEQHPARDRYREGVFRIFFREGLESGGALIARDCRDGRVIGSSRFHGYDPGKSVIEIGWTFLAVTLVYDFGDNWQFTVKLERVEPPGARGKAPRILEQHGKAPEQYPNWDDGW